MDHKAILARYGVRAKKALGQNFLVSSEALESIVSAVSVAGEHIVEVGPGYWALSERLLSRKPESLTLVELDGDMIDILEDRVAIRDLIVPEWVNFTIQKQDVLTFESKYTPYSVIANIPYYITSPILYRFFYEVSMRPKSMVILMQKEVADRIRAKDGKHTYLSLFCAYACESIEEITKVPAGAFIPAPKVDSAVLRFICRSSFNEMESDAFLKLVRAGFSAPRKKLASNLAGFAGFSKESITSVLVEMGIREDVRPEALSLEEWITLGKIMAAKQN